MREIHKWISGESSLLGSIYAVKRENKTRPVILQDYIERRNNHGN